MEPRRVEIPPHSFSGRKSYDQITNAVIDRYAEFWRWRGDYLAKAVQCPAAVGAYRKALTLSPELPEAVAGIAECSR